MKPAKLKRSLEKTLPECPDWHFRYMVYFRPIGNGVVDRFMIMWELNKFGAKFVIENYSAIADGHAVFLVDVPADKISLFKTTVSWFYQHSPGHFRFMESTKDHKNLRGHLECHGFKLSEYRAD